MRLPASMGRNSDKQALQYELHAYFNGSAATKLLTLLPRSRQVQIVLFGIGGRLTLWRFTAHRKLSDGVMAKIVESKPGSWTLHFVHIGFALLVARRFAGVL